MSNKIFESGEILSRQVQQLYDLEEKFQKYNKQYKQVSVLVEKYRKLRKQANDKKSKMKYYKYSSTNDKLQYKLLDITDKYREVLYKISDLASQQANYDDMYDSTSESERQSETEENQEKSEKHEIASEKHEDKHEEKKEDEKQVKLPEQDLPLLKEETVVSEKNDGVKSTSKSKRKNRKQLYKNYDLIETEVFSRNEPERTVVDVSSYSSSDTK